MSESSKPEINVTPLIDVLLVLLIIFMVVTPVKPSKFEARVPSELKESRAEPHPLTLVVDVDLAGNVSINRGTAELSTRTLTDLTERLGEIFLARQQNLENEKTVFIKAPKNIDYGTVAKVVDAVKMAGAAPISLQIDRLD